MKHVVRVKLAAEMLLLAALLAAPVGSISAPLILEAPTSDAISADRVPLIPRTLDGFDPLPLLREYEVDSLAFNTQDWQADSLAAIEAWARSVEVNNLLHRMVTAKSSIEQAEDWLRQTVGKERLSRIAKRLRNLGYDQLASRLGADDDEPKPAAATAWLKGLHAQKTEADRALAAGDTLKARQQYSGLVSSLAGIDTLMVLAQSRREATEIAQRVEQLKSSALAAGQRRVWITAERLRIDATSLQVWGDQLLAEGDVAVRLMPEGWLREHAPGRMDTVRYAPLREAEYVEGVHLLRGQLFSLELGLSTATALPAMEPQLAPTNTEAELTEALCLRDEAMFTLWRLPSATHRPELFVQLEQAKRSREVGPYTRAREQAQRNGDWESLPKRERSALLLAEAELMLESGRRRVAETLADFPTIDPNLVTERYRLLARAELSGRRPDARAVASLYRNAARWASPEQACALLIREAETRLEGADLQNGAYARGVVELVSARLNQLSASDREALRRQAAELLAMSVAPTAAGWAELSTWLETRPAVALTLDGETELAFVRNALPEPDTTPLLLPLLDDLMASQPRPDILCRARALQTEVVERSGGSVETSWLRRRDLLAEGLPLLEGGAAGSKVIAAGVQSELIGSGEELISIVVQQLRAGEGDPWAERALESLSLFQRTNSDSTQLAELRFVLAEALSKPDDPHTRRLGLELLVETAEGWDDSNALRASETAYTRLAELVAKRQTVDRSLDSLFVRAARRRSVLIAEEREAQATLLNAGITLLRAGDGALAKSLFTDLISRSPRGEFRADAEEGLFEALLAMGSWQEVEARRDSLLEAGEGGRIASVMDNAIARMEVLKARQLREAGLPEEALLALKRAGGLDADPTLSAAAILEAGRMFADAGEWQRAEETFRGILELYPGQPAAQRGLYNLAALEVSRIASEQREPTQGEQLEIAREYFTAAKQSPESELGRTAFASAADHARLGGDESLELEVLSQLLHYHADHPGVRALLGRAGRLAWRSGDRGRAHELYLELTHRAPQSAEAVAAFLFLAEEAKRDGKLEDARWAWTMSVRAQEACEAAGDPGDRAMAQQARLALAQSHRDPFLAIRYELPESELARRKEQKRRFGAELVMLYEKPAATASIAGVRALFGIAEVEQSLAQAVQFQPLPEGLAPESLAVRGQTRALEAWAHRHAAIQALELAYQRCGELGEILAGANSGSELDLIGLKADALIRGAQPQSSLVETLAGSAADQILRQYDLSIIAQDDLLRSFAELPNRGETPLERATYRLALIDQFLRPRMLFLTDLKLEASRAANRYGRDPSFAGALFGHLLTPQGAASESITQMEIELPRLIDRYDGLIDRRESLDTTAIEELATLPDKLYDHQDLAIRYARLDIDIAREQLERVAGVSEYHALAMERAKRALQAAIEHMEEMDRHADRSTRAAHAYAELYESERHSLLREAMRLHEDLAQRWREGVLSLLEPAWAIPAQLDLRPAPETDRIARELARRDPSDYAYVLGLTERPEARVSDESWTWGTTAEEASANEAIVGVAMKGWNGAMQPFAVSAADGERTVWFRTTVDIEGTLSGGDLQVVASRPYEVYLNGRFAAETIERRTMEESPESWDVGDLLREGENLLLVRLYGEGVESSVAVKLTWKTVGKIDDSMKAVFPAGGALK